MSERDTNNAAEKVTNTDQPEEKGNEINPPAGLEEQLSTEKARAEEYYERWLRLQADFENFRRRTRKEKEEWFRMAVEDTVTSLLPVLDNFDRAVDVPGDNLGSFLQGVKMIKKQFEEVLTQLGLEPIEAVGREFDPNLHEAVARDFDSKEPENTVVAEHQKGYFFKGKVIRPAMVRVSNTQE